MIVARWLFRGGFLIESIALLLMIEEIPSLGDKIGANFITNMLLA